MSGELGLKNSFKERVWGPLQAYRGNDGAAGTEIGLIDFLNTRAKTPDGGLGWRNTSGDPISWEDIWCDLGLDPARVSLDNLISLSGDVSYLAPEIVREFVLKGMETDASYRDLIAGTENVDSLVVTSPWINYLTTDMQAVGEAETFPEAGVEWGEKTIRLRKNAIAIKLTDEIILSVKLPLLQYFMRRVGVQLGAKLYKDAVTTLINGDQTGGSDSCTIIGTASGSSVVFDDFVTAWTRARLLGLRWSTLVTDEAMTRDLLKLTEFKTPQGAGGLVTTLDSRSRIIPSNLPHLVSADMGGDHCMLLDPAACMVYLVFRGLLVESERIIMRQISGTACSLISGFSTIDRNARIIIDRSIAFSGNGFPSYMTPLV